MPVHDEERGLDASIRTLQATSPTTSRCRGRSRSPTTPAPIAPGRSRSTSPTRSTACAACISTRRAAGRALRTAWSASTASVVAYMDVDLSTDLDALLPLVAPLLSGHSDVAIGTRLASNARVVRGPKRELISRGYNLILRTTLRAGFSDAQCGFKARARRRRPRTASRWSRTRAGSSTPSCWCSPSTTGCASTRCRSTGSTTRCHASTSCAPPPTTSAACGGCSVASHSATARSSSTPHATVTGRSAARTAGRAASRRSAS